MSTGATLLYRFYSCWCLAETTCSRSISLATLLVNVDIPGFFFQKQDSQQQIQRNSHHLSQPTLCTKDEHLPTTFFVTKGHLQPVM